MRLNFSGVADDDLREGVRRIGKVVSEQVRLYSTLTGTEPAAPRRAPAPAPAREEDEGARIVPLRRRAGGDR
jgi:2-aminoadipate transaminase